MGNYITSLFVSFFHDWTVNHNMFSATKRPLECAVSSDNVKQPRVDESNHSTDNLLHINDLPHHVLISIFRNLTLSELLTIASLVCKFWHKLANDPDLWRVIQLKGKYGVDNSVLDRLTQLSDNVIHLDITDTKLITTEGLIKVAQHCQSLKSIKLVRCDKLLEGAFQAVASNCHQLREASFESCYSLSDDSLIQIAQGCPLLQKLRLGSCAKITSKGIIAVAEHCHDIKHLCLDQCCKVNDSCIEPLVNGCPNLECLSLSACDVTHKQLPLLGQCKKLRILELARVSNITDNCIISIVKRCSMLQSINLALCTCVTDLAVEAMAKYGTNLKNVYLVSCNLTDKALFFLGDYSKSVEFVDVGWCSRITDAGPPYISEKLSSLKTLNLMRCDKVADNLMDDLVKKYPHIHYSTMYLDCRRLIEKARQAGHLLTESTTQTLDSIGDSPNQQN